MTLGQKALYITALYQFADLIPDNKIYGAIMGPIWGRRDPGGPPVGPMNFAICDNAHMASLWWKYCVMTIIYSAAPNLHHVLCWKNNKTFLLNN